MTQAGYLIYHPDNPEVVYHFDKSMGSLDSITMTYENNRVELKTFGRVPYVYYAGHTDFQHFDLTTIFVGEYNDTHNDTTYTAFQQFQDFKKLLNQHEPLVVTNGKGEKLLCDVSLNHEVAPKLYSKGNVDYIEVTVRCVEIQ